MTELLTELWIQWIILLNYLTINFNRIIIVAVVSFLIIAFLRKGRCHGICKS